MTNKELVELGARWIGSEDSASNAPRQGANTYATRIHLRYDATSFPEDLVLMETSDRTNVQGRYVLHYPWPGTAACAAGESYRVALPARFEKEAANLAGLTGWPRAEIETRMEASGQSLQRSRNEPTPAVHPDSAQDSAMPVGSDTPILAILRAKLADALQRKADLLARYNSRHPAVVTVEVEVRDIERSIAAETQHNE
jgi:hypothetical protein